jgi:hypothetical protein
MTNLIGPAGGEWVRVNATGRDVPSRCGECGHLVAQSYQYYVGLVSRATLCLPCADDAISTDELNSKEETMTSTTPPNGELVKAEIALALEAAILDWEEGRLPSPDSRDYVIIAERILTERIGPEYLYLGDDTRELIADDLFDRQSNGELGEFGQIADYLVDRLTSEHEGEVA